MKKLTLNNYSLIFLLVAIISGILASADGRLHWDEPGYLYAGIYHNYNEIINADVEASGVNEFYSGRILHVLMIFVLQSVINNSAMVFYVLSFTYFALILFCLLLSLNIIRALMPSMKNAFLSITLLSMSPVIWYMAFKTLPDIPALAASVLATKSLVARSKGEGAYWNALAILGMTVSALTKPQGILMPASFWVTGCIIQNCAIDRRRLFLNGIFTGMASMFVAYLILEIVGVGINRYITSYIAAFYNPMPISAKILNIFSELGILWPFILISLFSPRLNEKKFMWVWLISSIAPLLILFEDPEARHLAVNLIAVGGLISMSLETVDQKFGLYMKSSSSLKLLSKILGLLILIISNYCIIYIMPHEVDIRQLKSTIHAIDDRYGKGNYTLLVPWFYTNFNIIRVLWPEIDVRIIRREISSKNYHKEHYITEIEELKKEKRIKIIMSYTNTFAAENLKKAMYYVSPQFTHRLFRKLGLVDHMHDDASNWLWMSNEMQFEYLFRIGHYLAYEAKFS